MKLKVESFVCNPFQERCYIVWDEPSRECLIIDPGISSSYEKRRIFDYIDSNHLVPTRILITHSHTDHVMGTGYLRRQYPDAFIYGSIEDQDRLPSVTLQNQLFGLDIETNWNPINKNLLDGDEFVFAQDHTVLVIDCPGHSHHGLCYYFPDDDILFSGDVLFCMSVGRSDFGEAMGGNGPLLIESIIKKLLVLPASVHVYPGHGPETTISTEATYNPYIL